MRFIPIARAVNLSQAKVGLVFGYVFRGLWIVFLRRFTLASDRPTLYYRNAGFQAHVCFKGVLPSISWKIQSCTPGAVVISNVSVSFSQIIAPRFYDYSPGALLCTSNLGSLGAGGHESAPTPVLAECPSYIDSNPNVPRCVFQSISSSSIAESEEKC